MLLENTARNVQSTGLMEVAKATIKATPKIFNFFADQTYANKPLAICRELVANAIDAHTAAGCPTRPVEVTLPIELDPTFKVKDYGIGMDHEFLMTRFMAYTDGSTKDGSNDQIGGFGIGSKSPFSYTDQFTIRSVKDHMLGIYSVFKDADGIPAIGCLGRTTTDEPNGVEVSFPVQGDDIATFHEAAQEALQYFKPLPVVINGTIDAPDYQYEAMTWGMRGDPGELGVIMGGVRYPVSTSNLPYELRSSTRLSPLLTYGLDLFLPIGACGVALSREALSYTGNTGKNIEAALEGLIDDVIATFSTLFDDCASLWDASAKLGVEVGFNQYGRSARAQLLMANARYHGQPLTPNISLSERGRALIDASAWWIYDSNQRGARTSFMTMKWENIVQLGTLTPGNIAEVIVDDLPMSPKSKVSRKIREHIGDGHRTKPIIVLRAPRDNTDPGYVRAMLAQLGSPSEVTYTSTMPEPASIERVKSERPRVRMWTFNGKPDRWTHVQITNLTPARSKTDAVAEIDYVNQPSTGIMVVMNSFDLPAGFHERMESKLIGFHELHFVNEGDWPKLKDTWQSFDEVFNERLKTSLAAYPELPTRIALYRNETLRSYFAYASLLGIKIDYLTPAQRNRPFGRMCMLWKEYIKPLTTDQHRLAPFVTAALPDRIDPDKLVASFKATQPDAALLLDVLDLNGTKHVEFFLKNV